MRNATHHPNPLYDELDEFMKGNAIGALQLNGLRNVDPKPGSA
jgi:hypothetical protein